MIIVKFCSGIGNQLFQYALYRKLECIYPEQEILADISSFEDVDILNRGNGFDYGFGLNKFFGIELNIASRSQIDSVNYEVFISNGLRKILPKKISKKIAGASMFALFRSIILKKYRMKKKHYITASSAYSFNGNLFELYCIGDYYFSGLWQNIRYFEDISGILRRELNIIVNQSNNMDWVLNQINDSNSVCIHVRRGDFTSNIYNESHNICGMHYYLKAIDIVKNKITNPKYFVFSDDIEFCKKNFGFLDDVFFVSDNSDLRTQEEMKLMSECKSAIISNSTFAFWAVWITDTPQKVVVCPQYATRMYNCWNDLPHPEHWHVVDNLYKRKNDYE